MMKKYRKWPSKWSKAEYVRAIIETSRMRGKSNEAILSSLTCWMYIGSMEPMIVYRVAKHLKGRK